MGIASDLSGIKDVSDTIVANKVSKFCYTDTAYEDNDANGVSVYNVNQEQNIPTSNPSIMKVNETVVTKGWRTRASSITRMFMNHMLGRLSYNVNKLTDMMSSLLTALSASLGTANGVATLDSNAILTEAQLPRSNVAEHNSIKPFTAGGMFDYMLGSVKADSWLGKVFGHLFGRSWAQVTGITSGNIKTVYHADNLWVAGGSGGLWWSADGKSWTQGTGISVQVNAVTYANGLWVAGAGVAGTGAGLWWSENGKDWYQGTGGTSDFVVAVTYANGLWVAGSGSLSNSSAYGHCFWSEDGKNWTQVSDFLTNTVTFITYANGLWHMGRVATGGGGLYWSADGKSWTQVSGVPTTMYVAYANGLWVAGTVTSSFGGGTYEGIFWSTDGKNWTQGTVGISELYLNEVMVITYSNGLWVAGALLNSGGSINGLLWSTDGKNWTQGTGATNLTFYHVTYANGAWLASGTSGCYWSTDGKSWTQGTSAGYVTEANVFAISRRNMYYAEGLWTLGCTSGCLTSGVDQLMSNGYLTD